MFIIKETNKSRFEGKENTMGQKGQISSYELCRLVTALGEAAA